MKYKKYSSYKDSGVEWLGEIPTEWNTSKIKHLFNLGRGRVISLEELEDDGKYPVYSSQTKHNGILGYIKTYDFNCRQITWTTDGANAGTVFLREGKHNCTNVCGTLQPRNKSENLKFITYSLQYATTFYKRPDTNGAKIMNGEMAEIFFTYPPIDEQQQIANFLDKATSKIDTLIEKQTKQIELLKEKRQAVISHAVTKGINPNVSMKDSGVEWLGEIPEHWEVGLLSTLFDNNSDKNKGMKNNNLLSLSYGRIINKDIETSFGLLPESFESYQIVKPGYIILRLTDLQNDKKSLRTGLVTQEGIITSAYVGLKKKSKSVGNEKFIHYYLHTFDIYKGFYGMGSGVRQSLNFDELKKLRFVLPPKNEQNEIVNYINYKTSKIDTLIEKSNKSIELLKEKRIALISAAVTGKIDVREFV